MPAIDKGNLSYRQGICIENSDICTRISNFWAQKRVIVHKRVKVLVNILYHLQEISLIGLKRVM